MKIIIIILAIHVNESVKKEKYIKHNINLKKVSETITKQTDKYDIILML